MMQFKNKKAQQLYYVFEMYNAVNEIERDKWIVFENIALDNDKISNKALEIINRHMNNDKKEIECYNQIINNVYKLKDINPHKPILLLDVNVLKEKVKLIEQRLMLVRILIADLDILEKTNTNEILQSLKD
jgi:hypothetical protein